MASTADYSSETPDIAYWGPIHEFHDFYARLYSRGAVATFVLAVLSLPWFPEPVSAFLFVGGTLKALLWVKHLRSKRKIEARGSTPPPVTDR